MKRLAVIVCILLSGSFSAFAQGSPQQTASQPPAAQQQAAPAATTPQIDPQKEADIRQLLKLLGTRKRVAESIQRMETGMKPLLTNSFPPGAYRDKLIALFFQKVSSKFVPQTFIALAIPVYGRNFTDQDIKGLIRFYQTPLGRKAARLLPVIAAELSTAARKMGAKVGRQSMAEVLSEHPDLAKALVEARRKQQQQ